MASEEAPPPVRAPARCTLEPRVAAHAEELFAVLSDPALYEFLDDAPPVSVGTLRDRLARSESRRSPDGTEQWLNWIVRDEAGAMAGYVQATVCADGTTYVAYVFGRAFHGRGLATQAVTQMIERVTAEFGVGTYRVVVDRRNTPSLRLAARLGFGPAPAELLARLRVAPTDCVLVRGPG